MFPTLFQFMVCTRTKISIKLSSVIVSGEKLNLLPKILTNPFLSLKYLQWHEIYGTNVINQINFGIRAQERENIQPHYEIIEIRIIVNSEEAIYSKQIIILQ